MADDLDSLAADLTRAGLTAGVKVAAVVAKAAHDVEALGKAFAPVDTGALRGSITTTIGALGLSAEIGPSVDYGAYVEYGTSRQAPAAYMGPALDRVSPDFAAALEVLGGTIL